MKQIRLILYPLAIALILLYFQIRYVLPGINPALPVEHHSLLVQAIFLGLFFGLLGCPACSLPLGFSLTAWHSRLLRATFYAVIFNIFRLLAMFIYAFIGDTGFGVITHFLSWRYAFLVSTTMMIIFSIIVLAPQRLHACIPAPKLPFRNLGLLYGCWGFVFGIPCAIEATGFLIFLWSYPLKGVVKLFALFLFSLCAIVPLVLLTVFFIMGIHRLTRIFSWCHRYIQLTSFFYLLFTGLIFLVSGFIKN